MEGDRLSGDEAGGGRASVGRAEDQDVASVLGISRMGRRRGLLRRVGGWLVALAVAVAVAGAVVWSTGNGSGTAVRYVLQKADRGDLTVVVTATGTVQPTNKVDISSELSGTVRSVAVDYNSPVTAGQVLATLDSDKLEATVESSRAKLAASRAGVKDAEATLEEAKLVFDRKKALIERNAGTPQDLDAAKAAMDRAVAALAIAKADVAAAEADVKLNEANLTKAAIRAPINGVVLQRNVDPGQTVASSFQAPVLFTIAEDLRQMEVRVDVDEADVGKVAAGQDATFSVDAYPDRVFTARIREVRYGSEIVQGVVTYKAVLTTDNADLLLRPGMTATAEITVQKVTDVLTAPNAALRFTPSDGTRGQAGANGSLLSRLIPGRPVFRRPSRPDVSGAERTLWVLRDGVPAAVPVSVGVSDGKRTEIVKGDIAPGQEVIVDSARTGK